MPVVLSPNDRFAVIGKTGSGKTWFTMVLAGLMVDPTDPDWQVWWLDSKLDPKDAKLLRQWGFGTKEAPSRKHIKLDDSNGIPVELQAQAYCRRALERKNVLVVIDEYKHVTISTRRAGKGIEGVHLRGRGLNVGMAGQTQEPVEIPRQLISQATHIFLFDLSYATDIAYMRKFYPSYERPPDPHGFWHCHVDGEAKWRYYPHVRAWFDTITKPQKQRQAS